VYFTHEGRRKTIYLGRVSQRAAEAVCLRVEQLIASADHAPSPDLREWIAGCSEGLRSKLEAAGLIEARPTAELGAFIDGYIAERVADTKTCTRAKWGTVRRLMLDHFGPSRRLATITAGDAESWRLAMLARGRADNTVRRACGIAKQWGRAAVRSKLIAENPFGELVSALRANPSRYAFIDRETAEQVIDACPDAEWRLLFALARWGGLRVPSEALELRWSDIDWQRSRFTVRSPKTAYQGKPSRVVPIFPELLPHLMDAWELAQAAPDYSAEWHCIRRYRGGSVNLRTQLGRILARASVTQWPKLWQNLRSTRETELAERFPIQAVVAWIGNTEAVARKHYLQTTEAHFEEAARAGEGGTGEARSSPSADLTAEAPSIKATQKAMRAAPKNSMSGHEARSAGSLASLGVFGTLGDSRELHSTKPVGLKGLEPSTSPLSGVRSSQLSYKPVGSDGRHAARPRAGV